MSSASPFASQSGSGGPLPPSHLDPATSRIRQTRRKAERYLDVLYRRRWIVIACFLLALAIAATLSAVEEPVYQASATVLLDLNRMPGAQHELVLANTPFVRNERSIATEIFILQHSGEIASRVNARLRQAHEAGQEVIYPSTGWVQFSAASRSVGSAISVVATSRDPREAALLANVYAQEYVQHTQDASRSHASTSRAFLEEQEARRREELRQAEDALQAYLQRTGTVGLSREGAGLVDRIVGLSSQREEVAIEAQMRRAQLETIERELAAIQPHLVERKASTVTARLQPIQTEIALLYEERRRIEAFDAAQRPEARQTARLEQIDRRIAMLEDQVRDISSEYLEQVMAVGGIEGSAAAVAHAADLHRRSIQERIALNGLEARLASMSERLRQNQRELDRVPELSTDLARLERDRQHAEQMYQYVVQRLQDVRIAEESEPGYARVLRQAGVPGAPMGPDPWRNLGVGLLLGLLVGIAMAFARDRLDTRIYKAEQLQEVGLQAIGVIPDLRPVVQDRFGQAQATEREGALVSTSLTTLHDPLSSPSEAYRHLRTAIQFSRMDQFIQKVLVTSPGAGDGKSTTAANLAVTMAQAKRRTLLIDTDLHRPTQHRIFGIDPAPGLLDLLSESGRFSPDRERRAALERWIEPFASAQQDSLYVLPCGLRDATAAQGQPGGENPAELLGSKRMRELLDALCELFDVIILDVPPVLAATEALLLSTQADATIVVARAGRTKEADLEHTLRMLHDVGARVPGVLLNGFALSMAYGYRYSLGHYTRYGPYSRYGYHRGSERRAEAA